MNTTWFVIALAGCSLAACISHEGKYAPSCVAFAGSTIEFTDGQFVWEKFTDALVVDDDGQVVDSFPDYPKHGSYRIEGQIVHMETVSDEALDNMYLHRHDDRNYLLTTKQSEAFEKTGQVAECALVLGGNRRS